MNTRFNYLTIPHSGTRFLREFFWQCGYKNPTQYPIEIRHTIQKAYSLNHYMAPVPGREFDIGGFDKKLPTISTLRHPHRVAVSWFTDYRTNHMIDKMILSWDQYIKLYATYKVILFDIDCPKELRSKHLISILKQANLYKPEHDDIAMEYGSEWKPVGASVGDYKSNYLKDGSLPKYDWSRFDRAVNWYNKVINDCIYDYDNIPS